MSLYIKNDMGKKTFLNIACAAAVAVLCANSVQAQSRFHFDVDYHYNLGLSTSIKGGHWGRSNYKMGGHSIHFTGRYDLSDALSAGAGFGWDRYTEPNYNTLPIFATLRYKPIKTLRDVYCFTDLGYGIKPKDTYNSGFLMNLGVGYTKMFSPHFGLNFQIAYNCKVFDDGIMYAVADEHGNYVDGNYLDNTRHSISFGVGVTF